MLFKRRTAMKFGMALGAGVMYLTDPEVGDKRRNELLDRAEEILQKFGLGDTATALRVIIDGGDDDDAEEFRKSSTG